MSSPSPVSPALERDNGGIYIPSTEFAQIAACVFERISVGTMITNAAGVIVSVNAAFSELSGYSREEVIGQRPSMLQSGRQDQHFYAEMWNSLRTFGNWSGIVWNRRKDGAHYAELLTISSICAADGSITHYIGTFSDVTHAQEYTARLEHLAHYDSLTELPNRVLLADRLRQAMGRARRQQGRLAVCYLDLDRFKPVNDMFGHPVGDELLILAARRMSACLRESDTLARIGGDEFAILLCDLPDETAHAATLERLLQALEPPFHLAGQALKIGACIGATLYPDDLANADDLLNHADVAMYAAKHAGGNTYRMYQREMLSPN